ncbi:MAG: ABC transporter substrate-binding protein [Anaerofustis stercorihominis]|nr:ABC transporter substrate-binding protein [Anaerofustis stercorihominis]
MKKVLCVLISMLLAIGMFACGESTDELTTINVSEVTHSIFYAPQYVAMELGYFEEYGIKVELTNAGGADKVMAALLSGDCQIGLAGPEQTIYLYNAGQQDYVVNFAQLTQCDGSFLIAREPDENFTIEKLRGSHIIGGRVGGMPVMVLEYILRKNGITPNVDCIVDTSVAFNAMSGAFIGGTGDYVSLFEPNATTLEKAEQGYVVMSLGTESGSIPYTVYQAQKSYMQANPEIIEGFTKAIQKGLDYVWSHSAEETAQVIAPHFTDTSVDDMVKVINRYKEICAFAEDTLLKKDGFELLQDIMQQSGQLDTRTDYSVLVDTTYANH